MRMQLRNIIKKREIKILKNALVLLLMVSSLGCIMINSDVSLFCTHDNESSIDLEKINDEGNTK